MLAKSWHSLHKWLALTSGLALLTWLGSGLVLMLPPSVVPVPTSRAVGPAADYSSVVISPADAASALDEGGERRPLGSMTLRRIGEVVAYQIALGDDTSILVDARDGRVVVIDSAFAVELVRRHFEVQGPLDYLERIDRPNRDYPGGDLPALQMRFSDLPGDAFTVSPATGEITRSFPTSRARVFVGGLHTFQPLRRFLPDWAVRLALIFFVSTSTAAVAVGFQIGLPGRSHRAQR